MHVSLNREVVKYVPLEWSHIKKNDVTGTHSHKCANFVNLYKIKLNQIVVLPLHGAGENVISYFSISVQPH